MPLPPAQLLRRRALYVNPAIYGFPLHRASVDAFRERVAPFPADMPDDERKGMMHSHLSDAFGHLEEKCFDIWDSNVISIQSGYLNGDIKKYRLILVLVKATRRDDRFIPPPEIMSKLKEFMTLEGFTEEPTWVVANN